MRIFWVWRERNQQLNQLKKGQHRGIEDLLKSSPMFLFFYFNEIEDVSSYTKETPKMAKNVRLY